MFSNLMKKTAALLLLLLTLAPVFAAGSKEGSSAGVVSSEELIQKLSSESMTAKFDPPIDLTAWRYLNNGIKFPEGSDIENNIWIDYYREVFGINLSYAWVIPEEQFLQKLNISVASGDLPDLMWLDNKNLIELAQNDLLYDLTDLYEARTSDFTKSILEQDRQAFDTAKVNGRLMAIPHTASSVDSLQVLHIRTDWLENLGLAVPTTMEELLNVIEAFTNDDPDGNGKDDTYGIAFTKNFIKDNHAGATGFFAGFHGYIRRWVEDGKGNLAYGTIQPEVRTALLTLQDLYRKGMIDPEFGVKDRAKVTESIASGKIGITYGGMSTPGAFVKDSVINDPKAEWKALKLVSIDNNPAKPITKLNVSRYYAINKNCAHPEAIIKLVEAGSAGYARDSKTTADEWADKLSYSKEGIALWQYQVLGYEPAMKNLNAHRNVVKALETGDTSILNLEEQGYYDRIKKYRAGDRNFWGDERIFGSPSSFEIIGEYVESGDYLYDKFYGALTPTMVERNATLEALEDEVFTKIIMGESIESFDKFVKDWLSMGGAKITEEVNAWYSTTK